MSHNDTQVRAIRELELAGYYSQDSAQGPDMPSAILSVIAAFGRAGHSGGSAGICGPSVAETVRRLLAHEPLTPLTGEDSEWNDVTEEGGRTLFQNNRCGHVFKDDEGIYDVEGRVFEEPDGARFTAHGDQELKSVVYVTMPYTPTREYVKVTFRLEDKS